MQQAAQRAAIDNLKAQYEACNIRLAQQKATVDRLNQRMADAEAAGDSDTYSALIPEQHNAVAQYDTTFAQCRELENRYDEAVTAYDGVLN